MSVLPFQTKDRDSMVKSVVEVLLMCGGNKVCLAFDDMSSWIVNQIISRLLYQIFSPP